MAASGRQQRRKVIHALLRGQTRLACNLDSSEPEDSVSLVLWYKDGSMVPIFSLDARSAPTVQEARHKPGPLLEGRSSLKLLWLDSASTTTTTTTNLHAGGGGGGGGATDEPATTSGRSRRHTSESRHRKRRSRRRPEGENDDNNESGDVGGQRAAAISAALLATTSSTPPNRGRQQLWAQLQIESLSSEDNGLYVCRVDFRRARSRVQELSLKIIGWYQFSSVHHLSGRFV